MANSVTPSDVAHVADLANLPVNDSEKTEFAQAFSATLAEIERLQEIDTSKVEPTHQVNGLVNVWRRDEVDESRILDQSQVLDQAKNSWQGQVVVDRIIDEQ
jgi:aspartyl-tRNA(Asn)/glutamyl-tRNA(Gln) amidotransferase subunit C